MNSVVKKVLFTVGAGLATGACSASVENDYAPVSDETTEGSQEAIKNGVAVSGNTVTGGAVVVQVISNLDGNDGVIDGQWDMWCSGLIVSRDMVVTSAHCLRGNVPAAGNRWWTKNIPVKIGYKTQTGGALQGLTLAGGQWAYLTANARVHPSYNGFMTPAGVWNSHTVPNDIATIKFSVSFPGVTGVPWMDAGNPNGGATYNGWLYGYGTDGATADLRAGFFTCSKANGIYSCNSNQNSPQSCPGDSGGPFLAGTSVGIPSHFYAMPALTNCLNFNQAAPVLDNLSFVTSPISARCTTQTFVGNTPPPQPTKTLTRCF